MNEKGQEKECFGATVQRALIYKYTYLWVCVCGYTGSSDSPPSTAAYQHPAAVWSMDTASMTAQGVIAPLGRG